MTYAPGIVLRPWTVGGTTTTEAGEALFTRAKAQRTPPDQAPPALTGGGRFVRSGPVRWGTVGARQPPKRPDPA